MSRCRGTKGEGKAVGTYPIQWREIPQSRLSDDGARLYYSANNTASFFVHHPTVEEALGDFDTTNDGTPDDLSVVKWARRMIVGHYAHLERA